MIIMSVFYYGKILTMSKGCESEYLADIGCNFIHIDEKSACILLINAGAVIV